MGEKLTGKSSGNVTAIQAPQWARRSELVSSDIPAMSVQEGDVYESMWLVTLAVRFYMAEPPCVVIRLENMHRQAQVEILRGSDVIRIQRLPEEPSTKPPMRSGHPEYDVEADTLVPPSGSPAEDPDTSDTIRPEGHSWSKVNSYRGEEGAWDEWLCSACNLHIRTKGDSRPSQGMCEGAPTGRFKRIGSE